MTRRGLVRRRAGETPPEVRTEEMVRYLKETGRGNGDLILLSPLQNSRRPPPLPPHDTNNNSGGATASTTTSSATSSVSSTETSGGTSGLRSGYSLSYAYHEFASSLHLHYTSVLALSVALWVVYLILPKGFKAHYFKAYPRRYAKSIHRKAVSVASSGDPNYEYDFMASSAAGSSSSCLEPVPLQRSERTMQEQKVKREVRRQLLLQQLKDARTRGKQAYSWSEVSSRSTSIGLQSDVTSSTSEYRGAEDSGIGASRSILSGSTEVRQNVDALANALSKGSWQYRATKIDEEGDASVDDTSKPSIRSRDDSGIIASRSLDVSRESIRTGESGIRAARSVDSSRPSRRSGDSGTVSTNESKFSKDSGLTAEQYTEDFSGGSAIGTLKKGSPPRSKSRDSTPTRPRVSTPTRKSRDAYETPPRTPPRLTSTPTQSLSAPPTPTSPKHPTGTRVPPDAMVWETMQRLQGRGIRMVAHGVQSLPKRVWIKLDMARNYVTWQTESLRKIKDPASGRVNMTMMRGSLHRIPLPNVLYVDVGKRTMALVNKVGVEDSLCFSLLTHNGSLDLQTNSVLERDCLVCCFCLILDEVHQGQNWRALYEGTPAPSSAGGTNESSVGDYQAAYIPSDVAEV